MQLGKTLTLVTNGELPEGRTFYIRVGARVKYGLNYYNYSTIEKMVIP